jgi:hypothetical protein
MIVYRIQKTAKGDFIVRDTGGREMARRGTESEAEQWIVEQHAREEAEATAARERQAQHKAFNATVTDLNRLQIRWQNWRNWFYEEMTYAARKTAQFERAQDMKFDEFHASPSFQKQQRYLTDEIDENARAADLYDEMVTLDTRMKNARQHHDMDALAVALIAAEPLIERMNGFFAGKARPDEYKRPPGRPPAAGTQRQVRLSITVPPEYSDWLREHGDISEQIRALIERAMG